MAYSANPKPTTGSPQLYVADWNAASVELAAISDALPSKASQTYVDERTAAAMDLANATGSLSADRIADGMTNTLYSKADRNKLAGIAAGATANASDAQLVASARDAVGAAIVAGTPGATYSGGQITVPAGTGSGSTVTIADHPTNPLAKRITIA